MAEKKRSSSLERRVQGYLKPQTETLFRGFVEKEEVSESEAVNIMVKTFFNSLTPQQRLSYLSRAHSKNSF